MKQLVLDTLWIGKSLDHRGMVMVCAAIFQPWSPQNYCASLMLTGHYSPVAAHISFMALASKCEVTEISPKVIH